MFGAYDLNDLFQSGALSSSPAEIFIHPDWNPFVPRYDADIAALVLDADDQIPYTRYIRPICLSSSELDAKEGFVTGWGESEDKRKEHENLPKQIKIPIEPNETCFLESSEFAKIASTRTICGGSRNNSGPCRGDSGGGLFVRVGNVFYLKGLVSASLLNAGQCDVTNYALYTNVDKFIDWIENPTEESASSSGSYGPPAPPPSYAKPTYAKPSYVQPSYVEPSSTGYNTIQKPSDVCGIMNTARSLIQGGSPVFDREVFPWTVATYFRQNGGSFTYFSTGTLISSKHVISTGLSVAYLDQRSQKYVARSPNDFRMVFGVSNLDETSNPGSFTVEGAEKVILHPNIKHGYPRIANVGILVLKTPVTFSDYVKPACLPTETIDVDENNRKSAVAVGWGQDDTGNDSKVKNYAIVAIKNDRECERSWSSYLAQGGSSKFFCAGGDGKKSACYRDQPLYLKNGAKWYLRGLILIAANQPDNRCNLNIPVLYEDIGQYYDWIRSLID